VTEVAPPRRPAGTTPSAAFCRSVGLEDPGAESCRRQRRPRRWNATGPRGWSRSAAPVGWANQAAVAIRHRLRLEATKGHPSPEPARAREQAAETGPAVRARAPKAEALDPATARARAPGPERRRGSRSPPLAAAARSSRS
jgi:hypothetical protein